MMNFQAERTMNTESERIVTSSAPRGSKWADQERAKNGARAPSNTRMTGVRSSWKGVILFHITIFPSLLSILVPIQSRLPYLICSNSVLIVFLGEGRAFGTQQLPTSLDPDIQPHRPDSMPSAPLLPPTVILCTCLLFEYKSHPASQDQSHSPSLQSACNL